MDETDEYADIDDALERVGLDHSAFAYHGLLCGALCVQEAEQIDPLRLVEGELPEKSDHQAESALKALRDRAHRSLADMHHGFVPLLPPDAVALSIRARALSEWCEGFLYGLAGRRKLELRNCSEEVREIVKDFTEFTRAVLEDGDNLETEENAYAELVEYVRVGAQLVFMELRQQRLESAPSRTLH